MVSGTLTLPKQNKDDGPLGIDISISCRSWSDALPSVVALCRTAVTQAVLAGLNKPSEQIPKAEISLVLSDNEFIRELNKSYRQIDKPTNVLAFPGDAIPEHVRDPSIPLLLGDVVVAYETAALEAETEQKTLADHLQHLVVHGTLHLLGHDHDNETAAEEMEALEAKALQVLGVKNPYGDG